MPRCLLLALLLPFIFGLLLADADQAPNREDAPREESAVAKSPSRKPAVPATSEDKAKLAGTWILDNASLEKAVGKSLQAAAGKDSAFEVASVKGDYLATIDLAGNKIVVEWKDWQLAGVSRSERTGDSKLVVKVAGREEYELSSLTDGEKPGARRWIVKAGTNTVKSTLTFRGFETKSRVPLPTLANGLWTVHKDRLFLQGRGEVWTFQRQQP